MRRSLGLAGASLAGLVMLLSASAASAQTTVCYAFQDLSTGFWVAGHKAIVDTLTAGGVETGASAFAEDEASEVTVFGSAGFSLLPSAVMRSVSVTDFLSFPR